VASRDTLDGLGSRFPTSDERTLELKGLAAPVQVATVDWR
jgi:class 3 adenylate cyclase